MGGMLMAITAAGILLYKKVGKELQIMLVHPGGPFWAKKDMGAWTVPKGLLEAEEEPRAAAIREFREETGFDVTGRLIELGAIRQPSQKIIHVWAAEQDLDTRRIASNTFRLEWPKKSGRIKEFPEIDQGQWFTIPEARIRIQKGQLGFIEELLSVLADSGE